MKKSVESVQIYYISNSVNKHGNSEFVNLVHVNENSSSSILNKGSGKKMSGFKPGKAS